MKILLSTLSAGMLLLSSAAFCEESFTQESEYLGIFSPEQTSYRVGRGEHEIEIRRVMTPCAKNKGFLQPTVPVEGVTPVSEIEMLHALNDEDAIVVDMRTENYYMEETIPNAINIPYTEAELRLDRLGCKEKGNKWDCTKALKAYLFCNGPVCPQSPTGIRAMVRRGFPVDKIYYYRGGMLDWTALGLSTVKGEF